MRLAQACHCRGVESEEFMKLALLPQYAGSRDSLRSSCFCHQTLLSRLVSSFINLKTKKYFYDVKTVPWNFVIFMYSMTGVHTEVRP